MRLNEGRIGYAEGIAAAAAAVSVCAIFSVDPASAYTNGNSTYISIPLAALISLVPVLAVSRALERSGKGGLAEHLECAYGTAGAALFALPLTVSLLFCAARPMTCFLDVLQSLIYDGVSYASLAAFVFPVMALIAWKGFESIGRLALIVSGLLVFSLVFAVASAAPSFETYRLYPLMGVGAARFTQFTASELMFTLTPMSALLVCGKGLNGIAPMRKTAAAASIVSAAVCFSAQFAISLVYSYKGLTGLLMPLYRINFLSLAQSYALRLDKLFVMVWLSGAIVSSAYCVYAAARLHAGVFRERDITPAAASFSLVVCAAVLAAARMDYTAVKTANGIMLRFGAALPTVTLTAALAKGRKEKKC
ncbi:MAG: GerAB/ArcD/ProY family transporter [Clostridia bacterium]|nr:GerAB/ArcD/ProY family transporter [Clostridia bacterium]